MRQSCKTLAASLCLSTALAGGEIRAVAADLGTVSIPGEAVSEAKVPRPTLEACLRVAEWAARWFPAARELVDAIEELMRLLEDARRAAEAHRKLAECGIRAKPDSELEGSRTAGDDLLSLSPVDNRIT